MMCSMLMLLECLRYHFIGVAHTITDRGLPGVRGHGSNSLALCLTAVVSTPGPGIDQPVELAVGLALRLGQGTLRLGQGAYVLLYFDQHLHPGLHQFAHRLHTLVKLVHPFVRFGHSCLGLGLHFQDEFYCSLNIHCPSSIALGNRRTETSTAAAPLPWYRERRQFLYF